MSCVRHFATSDLGPYEAITSLHRPWHRDLIESISKPFFPRLIMLSLVSRLFMGRVGQFSPVRLTQVVARVSYPMSSPTAVVAQPSIGHSAVAKPFPRASTAISDFMESLTIWLIKRTYQPSILRKKRKHGFLKRSSTVGGRRTTRRRKAKGRTRIYGA